MRINKYIASSGYCSRRQADKLIEQGVVKVNGKLAVLGTDVGGTDKVEVNAEEVSLNKEKVYLAFNKPFGVITTTSKESDNNIASYIDYPTRVFPVGRLDVASSGLILFTNDGALAQKIMRKENKVEKEYIVELNKDATQEFINKLRNGVQITYQYKSLPCQVKRLEPRKLSLTLAEGKNRQVRQMCEHLGYKVKTLTRVRIANIKLDTLKTGRWRKLNSSELKSLPGG